MCGSAVARAFAAAEVSGDDGLLDPTTLYEMGFDLVREGQSPLAARWRHRAAPAVTGVDR